MQFPIQNSFGKKDDFKSNSVVCAQKQSRILGTYVKVCAERYYWRFPDTLLPPLSRNSPTLDLLNADKTYHTRKEQNGFTTHVPAAQTAIKIQGFFPANSFMSAKLRNTNSGSHGGREASANWKDMPGIFAFLLFFLA